MKVIVRTLTASLLLAASAAHAEFQLCPKFLEDSAAPAHKFNQDVTLSPYTVHWHPSEDHKPVVLVGYNQHLRGDYFCGFSVFSNSFGQPSATVYVGRTWENFWPSQPLVYGKIVAGIMYGYKGKFKDKVPLNYGGFSPLVLPALGYQFKPQDAVELQLLGNSALMFSYVHRF